MDSVAPFPFSALSPNSEVSVALQAFRWLCVLGFPMAVAAATVWPDVFTLDDKQKLAAKAARG
jgi:hypothetical protein